MMGRWTSMKWGLLVFFLLLIFQLKGWTEERYTVKEGDSLYKVSKSFGVSIDVLKKVNGLEKNAIRTGSILFIPTRSERRTEGSIRNHSMKTVPYVVRKGDSFYSISKRVGLTVEEIKNINQLHATSLKVGQILILSQSGVEKETEELEKSEESAVERLAEGSVDQQETAETLGKWNNPEERNLFIKVVKNFLGVPYRLGGSTLKGIDCSAFVKKIYEIFNVNLPRTAREQFNIGKKIAKEKLEDGDLVFFKARRSNISHVGIYIGNNEFVHASNRNKEVRVDNLDTPYFNKHFLNGVRVKEMEEET